MKWLLPVLILVIALPVMASGVDENVLADPAKEAEARAIMEDLRCLVCQNQSIDDSNADMAADLRAVVRERVLAGDNAPQIYDYMVARYGDWILMRPPVNESTWVLWLMPAILIVLGLLVISVFLRRGRAQAQTVTPLSAQEEADLETVIGKDHRG
ncbi:MAG: cytochrome c-type biogenesis protein CcmH [Alphaproteobacteria bacterium]|nr:MAG: cytochrome c-type biogenesis protein CcmH [Alphaproteobacteria bacterium]